MKRGKPSNRRLSAALRAHVLELVGTLYADFGPTFAAEKLRELHAVSVSVETLRKWMTVAGLWHSRMERRRRPQQPRNRRSCLGELVHIDGSDHEWLKQRGPRCSLLVYVDDAPSQLMHLHFARSESTFAYFRATQQYLGKHGRPVAFYSDKATIFRVNAKEARSGDGHTQFGRAMHVRRAARTTGRARARRTRARGSTIRCGEHSRSGRWRPWMPRARRRSPEPLGTATPSSSCRAAAARSSSSPRLRCSLTKHGAHPMPH